MKSFRSSTILCALAIVAALGEFSMCAQQLIITNTMPMAVPRRASIIIIQCDGLGYGDLSCYGQTNYQTPNLDKLAAEGIRFTNYYVAHSASTTRAALLLGENYSHAAQEVPLMPEAVTMAQVLKTRGYLTGFVGNWDLGGENSLTVPWKKGFDQFAGYLNDDGATNFFADYIWSLPPDYTFNPLLNKFVPWKPSQGAPMGGKEELYKNTIGRNIYIPDILAKAAVNFINVSHPDVANHRRPFFLMLNYSLPDENLKVPTDAPYSEEAWPQAEKNRAALITRIDDSIGVLRTELEKDRMTNNVLIFFAGASIPQKTREMNPSFFHSNLATNDYRVPMIAHWPDHITPGQVSGLDCSAADFLPTMAEIGYAKAPGDIDGTSILPELGGKQQ